MILTDKLKALLQECDQSQVEIYKGRLTTFQIGRIYKYPAALMGLQKAVTALKEFETCPYTGCHHRLIASVVLEEIRRMFE